jgi:MFS family permease
MFSSLAVKDFRLYWIGMFVSLVGTWIQSVAQSWLVFQLTHSALLLGLVGFLGAIPVFVLSLFAGVVADRVNKKKILLVTQNAFMLLAFLLAVLTHKGFITTWQIMVIALANGVVMAFDAPARQAMVVELVGKDNLLNAIALNSAAFNSARIIGPAVAGILIAAIGMSGCFYINGVSFLAVIFALGAIQLKGARRKTSDNHLWRDLWEGLEFIRRNETILVLIAMVAVSSLFGIAYITLMPMFADQVLGVGSKGLGALMAASGAGALIAALGLAFLGDFKYKGRLMMAASFVFARSLIGFSLSRNYGVSLAALVGVGWASVTCISIINTLLQTLVADEFRGRTMSVFMFTFAGMLPFGNLFAGSLAHVWGVSQAVAVGGVICGIFFAFIYIRFPQIRTI